MRREKKEPEGDPYLKEMFRVTSYIVSFVNAVKKEMEAHPDYKAEEMTLDNEHISIVLKRYDSYGVLHSVYVAVVFDESE